MAFAGHIVMVVALVVCLYGIAAALYGARRGRRDWVDSGRRSIYCLAVVLTLIPIGVWNAWSIYLTGGLLVLALVLVFFVSLTVIFLLRLVAADRRARRRPLRSGATRTVGQLEDDQAADPGPPGPPGA